MAGLQSLSTALQAATAWTFEDAILVAVGAGAPVSNGQGGFTSPNDEAAIKARVDQKRSYSPERGTFIETRIIILAGSLTKQPEKGNAVQFGAGPFDEDAAHYILTTVRADGLASHFTCGVQDG